MKNTPIHRQPNITCPHCRHRHPANLSCERAKQLADEDRAAFKPEPPLSNWGKLRELIMDYAEAYLADSCKGGGDPEAYGEIEARLELQKTLLNTHIDKMERERP